MISDPKTVANASKDRSEPLSVKDSVEWPSTEIFDGLSQVNLFLLPFHSALSNSL